MWGVFVKQTIYLYRMTNDTGCAPCIFENDYKATGILTLACCKGGQLRKSKGVYTGLRHTIGKRHFEGIKNHSEKVFVVGLMKQRIIYVAEITDICEMKDYFSNKNNRFRKDFIYTYSEQGCFERNQNFYLVRNNNTPAFHPKDFDEMHRRDELGKYVLISDSFAYFGKEEKLIRNDEIFKNLLPNRQETKTYHNTYEEFEAIMSYIDEIWKTRPESIIKAEPSERLNPDCSGCTKDKKEG